MKLVKKIGFKTLTVKSLIFMAIWTLALFVVEAIDPELMDWERFTTAMFSNTLTFLIGYILTVVGYRYSKKDKR